MESFYSKAGGMRCFYDANFTEELFTDTPTSDINKNFLNKIKCSDLSQKPLIRYLLT